MGWRTLKNITRFTISLKFGGEKGGYGAHSCFAQWLGLTRLMPEQPRVGTGQDIATVGPTFALATGGLLSARQRRGLKASHLLF